MRERRINVGVSTTSPWRALSVTGTVGFDGLAGSTGAGSLCLDGSKQVVYNSCLSSTRETKHDITPLSLDDLAIVNALEPVSFIYKNGDGRTRYGFIAEDAEAVDAHLATYNASGTLTASMTAPSAFDIPSSRPMSRAVTSSKLGPPKTACVSRRHAPRPRSLAHQLTIHRLVTRQRHQHFTLCHHCDFQQHPRHPRYSPSAKDKSRYGTEPAFSGQPCKP